MKSLKLEKSKKDLNMNNFNLDSTHSYIRQVVSAQYLPNRELIQNQFDEIKSEDKQPLLSFSP